MCARPYGPRRDCICRLMLDRSSKIPKVMHDSNMVLPWLLHPTLQVRRQLRSIGSASHHETDGTVAKSKRVIAAQHGMGRAYFEYGFRGTNNHFWREETVGLVRSLLCVYVHVSFDLLLFPGLTVAMPLFCAALGELSVIHPSCRVLEGPCFLSTVTVNTTWS